MSGMIVELAPFSLAEGVDESALLQASAALQSEFLETQDGFVRRDLLKAADGSWTDIVYWESEAAAKAAMDRAASCRPCQAYFSLMRSAGAGDPGVSLFSVRARYG